MAVITGTKLGARVVAVEESHSKGNRETWLLTASFAAYTASADTATIAGVGAYISGLAHDGKARTLKWAGPYLGADNGAGTIVYFTGASVDALTISTDALTGEISGNTGTETDTTVTTNLGIMVCVDAADPS